MLYVGRKNMVSNYCETFQSTVLGRSVPVRFIVPQGKDLPCLFLLHGYGGDENQWHKRTPIAQMAEEHKLVVVAPGCGDGYYEDTNEDMPRFLGEELLAYVRRTLPVSGTRENSYIAGISIGGFGAVLVGMKYSEIFGKIASLSGAFIIHDVAIGNTGVLSNADPEYFRSVFGDFESLEGSSRDPVAEAIRISKTGKAPALYLVCGQEDVLYPCNLKAVAALRDNGIPVVWHGISGNHLWPFWNSVLPQVIRWLISGDIPDTAENS